MLTAAQLRAARGLLDWTRTELAKAANISPETVKNIEHGTFRPQEQTADAIRKAFAQHDVIFTENEGVQLKKDTVTRYDGIEGFKNFMEDVYATAKLMAEAGQQDKPFYMSSLDDRFFIKYLGDFFTAHIQRMNALKEKFRMRILVKERPHTYSSDEAKKGSYREYRIQSTNVMGNVPFYVYGDKLAVLIFEEKSAPQIVVITSSLVAKAYREQFEILWNTSKPLNKIEVAK